MEGARKRVKIDSISREQTPSRHPTLCLYYAEILTLREYLLTRLPASSKSRRRKVASAEIDILNKTLVCITLGQKPTPDGSRLKDFEAFSQQVSLTARSSVGGASSSQSDLIDFAIWSLFHRIHRQVHKPVHMLCHGYQRASDSRGQRDDHCAVVGIPGLVSRYPNNNVTLMKDANWTEVLGLLGKEGDEIILDLVLELAMFAEVARGQSNYYQLSGMF